jgi:FixJ family two-component response regulator
MERPVLGAEGFVLTDTRTRVLVVDDDLAVRDSLKFALETEGLAVETYASGRQMFASKSAVGADCLVLDYKMPEMDGFAVMEELAARKIALPVILITAPVTDAIRRRAQKAGVFNLLEKPLLDGTLAETIRQAIAA